ncbi:MULTISPECIES: condensation domain-containing protein [unclassified Amycolatopsis]|uniref:condensation domain-containing protein n=1 Tax=unclassified Amycolatopsis TaxID=2618356 RepID=UPI0028768A9D|nr:MULTISPECIES: condensation domain-containing protein [unclassified Amycolatopsis]MDS0134365.1 peptide synthetase [Amycolatopsis sp. 505]MDS0148949.1 peptide synthetase [Amycolatopsis sp. CM201R]
MRTDDVAIIGVSALLPGAHGLAAVHDLLAAGRDVTGQPAGERLRENGFAPGPGYLPMGYLDRIDRFDHRFFGVPPAEAAWMDPHQRLILQLAHEALENACYAPHALRGSRTAVVLGSSRSDYEDLFDEEDPQQILGILAASLAARISYRHDFTGPALVLDTACSGSLVAVAHAVALLRSGAADLALAGGISVRPVPIREAGHVPVRGVESPEGRCRPFDEKATGAVGGEGGGIVVLKPLAAALADGDHVHAVLKGIAVNHNGYRMASMSAPSRAAQTEVITAAWRDAGVDPATVGYVECHGSATPLGDVVEVEALRQAFLDAGVTTPSCAIGSIKGNIGHLDNAAGVAGLVKVLLSVRRGVRYPTAHFETPNPLIDFGGPVRVNPAFGPWEDATPRRAGLSSFGLTGTNVHAVVEQPPEAPEPAEPDGTEHLVTVSAKTASALARYRDELADFAESSGHDVLAIGHAMNRGRDDHPVRIAVVAAEPAALATALRSAAVPDTPAPDDPPVVLLFSGDGGVEPELWADLCAAWPVLGDDPLPGEPGPRLVAVHHALHRLARSLGLPDTHLVGSGAGNLSVRIARGELSIEDGLAVAAGRAVGPALDSGRLAEAVRGFVRDGAVLVELGTGGVLSRTMRRLAPELGCVELIAGAGRPAVLRQVATLYRLGVRLDWDRHYAGTPVPRIEAPAYPLEGVRCWCRPPGSPSVETRAPEPVAVVSDVDTERRVAEAWARALGEDELDPGSDYFALGGTSIAAITALRTMERDFGVELTFADLYGHPTVRAFAARIEAVRAERGPSGDVPAIAVLPRGGPLPLSFGQEQLWFLDRLNPGSALYNIPHDLRLSGPLDEAALAGAVQDLLDRHEILRTCIPDDDGVPFTRLAEPGPRLVVHDLSTLPEAERAAAAHRLAGEEAVRPFDLATGPLVRITLVRLAEADHVLLWTYHHIVFDGWSPTIFFRDFTELYRARLAGRAPELPDLPFQFADFAAWQRRRLSGETLERGLRFWRAELAGLPAAQLPLDRPRPAAQSFDGDLVEFTIAEPAAEAARRFSREHGVTTFVTMLALVDALLHRWAGFTDVVVGVATSGRTHPATHDLMGYFNNLPPFRTRVEGELSFTDLVRRCADTVAHVLDHEEIPLEKIVSAVCGPREPGRQPLFDVAYTYQNVPQDTAELGGLECSRFSDAGTVAGIAPGTAKFDLTVGVIDQQDGPMDGYFEYATALFDRGTADALARLLPGLLDAVLREPGRPLAALPAVDGEPVPAPTHREPAMTKPSLVDSDTAGHAERVLAAICAELLTGGGPVGPKDNFFDLGGDSVLGVRVAARAAKDGVHFTPQQLLQCRTLGELARAAVVDGPAPVVAPSSAPAPEPPRAIPPTPIMLSFLDRMPDDVGDFVDVHTVETTPEIGGAVIRTAIGHLLALHEPLRYRLRRNALGARLEVADLTAADVFDTKVLPPLTTDEELGIVADDCLAMKAEMDPARGPLFRVRHYDRGRARGGLLVLLVNHFVFDNMSTVVVLDDLDVLLADLAAGRLPAPAPRPPRWREWAEHLRAMAASDELSGELTYWTATLRAGAAAGAIGGAPGDGITARTLDDSGVATLLAAGGAQGREAALCAVSCGLARWQGAPSAFVMTEGEATPNPFRLAGRGPSVGWFTTLHPLVLPVGPGTTARDCLPEIADRARSVPNDGVGYGMLRHLSPDSPGTARLRALPEPEVLVLHGPSDTSAFDSGVRLLRTRWDLSVNLKRAVASWFPLVVTSAVRDGALRLAVAGGVGQERLDALADEILGAFTELP